MGLLAVWVPLSVSLAWGDARPLWQKLVPTGDAAGGDLVWPDASVLVRGPTPEASRFTLVLPDGEWYRCVIDSTRFDRPDRYVSKGRLEGCPFGEFLFLVDRGRVAGMIAPHPSLRLRVLPTEQAGVSRVTQRALADVPPGGSRPPDFRLFPPRVSAPRGTSPAGSAPRGKFASTVTAPREDTLSSESSHPLIDVLIVYTPNAKTVVGGQTGVQYTANLAIELANDAYLSSLCNQRLRLAHLAPVQYYESGSASTDLDALTRPADGLMDEVITLRRDYRADLVHLFLANADLGDLGWLNNFSTFNETWSFSVSIISLVETDTFTRAVGSNMGLDHDWHPPPLQTPYPYSFGYAFTGNSGFNWGTLMSNRGANRIRLHSNPNVLWDGVPAGQPTTSATPAYAALSLNNTAATIEAIMDSTIVPPPVISSPVTATGTVGVPFQYQITATNGPTSFGASGLPLGLSVNTSTGLISGTPRQPGVFRVELSASNAGGTGVKILTLTIDEPSDCPLQRLARRLKPLGLLPPGWTVSASDQLLRQARWFRDEVLRTSPEGAAVIQAYYRHGPAVMQLLAERPEWLHAAAAAWLDLSPALHQARQLGQPLHLSAAQAERIHHLLDEVEAALPTDSRGAVAPVRVWLARHARIH
jgi:hypothetical protein